MKKILSAITFAICILSMNFSAKAATNNFVPLSEAPAEILKGLITEGEENVLTNANIVLTSLERTPKFDIQNENLYAYVCAYGIRGQNNPLGAIIFYENNNKQTVRIKFETLSNNEVSSSTLLLILMNIFQIIGLNDNEVKNLLQSNDAVKNVWNSSHRCRIMLMGADNKLLLFASEK